MDRTALLLVSLAVAALVPVAAATVPDATPTSPFSLDLRARAPFPEPLVVGYNETLPLVLHVDGPAGLVPPDEVRLEGADGRGTPLAFSPNPVPLEPGRHRYPVDARYEAPTVGSASLEAHARGPAGATANWTTSLPVDRDPVTVDVTAVGDANASWVTPVTVAANTTRLPAENATLQAQVRTADDAPNLAWNASRAEVRLTGTAGSWTLDWTARQGAGRYQVQVLAHGPRSQGASDPVLVTVEDPPDPEADAPVRAQVPDEPSTLSLADDTVNADGKSKYPGQEVITRVVAADANGLGHADGVAFAVHRVQPDGSTVPVRNETHPLPDDAWRRRSVAIEDRFGWAPLKDARYVVEARLLGTEADPATRTFRVLDEHPDLAGGRIPDAVAATPVPDLHGHALVADDNLGGGPVGPPVSELETLSARLYRHTHELAEPAGLRFPGGNRTLDLSTTVSHPDHLNYTTDGDAGRFRVPFAVELPEDPDPGPYHATLVHATGEGSRDLGALDFSLLDPPAVETLEAGPANPGQGLAVDGSLEHPDRAHRVRLTVEGPDGEPSRRVDVPVDGPTLDASVPVPEGPAPRTRLGLEAVPVLPDDRTGDPASTEVAVAATPPAVDVAVTLDGSPAPRDPLRLVPRGGVPLNLTVGADGVHGEAPAVSARLLDWNGETRRPADCRPGPADGHRCEVHVPGDLPAGRYTIQVTASGPGGETTWNRTLEAGPWLSVGLADDLVLEPTGTGTLAGNLTLVNGGNVPADRVDLALRPMEGPDGATWRPDPSAVDPVPDGVTAEAEDGSAVLRRADGPLLGPGDDLEVHVSTPVPAGVPPGAYEGRVTVTAPMGGFP